MTTSAPEGRKRRLRKASAQKARLARGIALGGYFALLSLVLCWFTWLSPPQSIPRVLPLAALSLPLLLPLRGLLHGRRYTHQWVGFLALFYFAIGIDTAWNRLGTDRALGGLMIACSLMLFLGSIFYARFTPSSSS